jgi:hypothetical protein
MEQIEDFKELTEIIRKTPPVQPPDDFAPRVMAAVMHAETGFYARALNFLARRREFTLDPARALRGQSSHNEMFVYFMLVAVAHLTFAFVLLIGFQNINPKTLLPPIVLLQPWLLVFLACWLGLWGLLLKKNTATGVRVARATTLIYIEAVVINGVLLFIQFHRILLLIPFIATIVGGTVAAGIFLTLICGGNNIRIDNSGDVCPGIKILV